MKNDDEQKKDPYKGYDLEDDDDDSRSAPATRERYRVVADPKQGLLRLDKFLNERIGGLSRTKIQSAISNEYVFVNESPVKSNYKVKPGDVVTVEFPADPVMHEVIPQNLPINIVYEDEHILVVNKSAGMVVHPGYNNWDGTLVNALMYHFAHLPTHFNGEDKPGLVHRIDKNTSGLLVVAKTEFAMAGLARQFFDHTIERTYLALVWGEPKEDEGTYTGNIGRSYKDRRLRTVYPPESEIGKHAVTHYKVLKRLRYVSLVQCNLETGRTHQIRVHFSHHKHPLFSDEMYGGDRIVKGEQFTKYKQFVDNCFKVMPRQALHAKSLGFRHPKTDEYVHFDSELPQDFQAVLDKWEHYVQYR